MKHSILFIITLALAFFLASCDFLTPQVVDQVSEQFCRDNPQSEICVGESVGDLENDVVKDVFLTISKNYLDTTKDTFCEDYFSVTNIDLLDSCRESREQLLPEDLSDFTIDSITKELSLSTEDVYTIKVVSPNKLTIYNFEIGLTKVEGIMYIDKWSYTEETVDPTTLEVPLDDAEAYFTQFLSDYENPNISSETICQTYFTDYDQGECIDNRDTSLLHNEEASLTTFTMDESYYFAEVSISDDTNSPQSQSLKVQFNYNANGEIIMTFVDDSPENSGNTPNIEDYKIYLNNFFYDFNNHDKTTNDFCNLFFIPEQQDSCVELYENADSDTLITFDGISEFDNHYLIDITISPLDGNDEQSQIEVWFYDILGSTKMEFKIEDNQQEEYDMISQQITNFLNSYNDINKNDDDAIDPFLDPATSFVFKDSRQQLLSENTHLVLNDLISNQTDNHTWTVLIDYVSLDHTKTITYNLAYYFDTNGGILLSFYQNNFIDDYTRNLDFMVDFLTAFNDSGLPNMDAINPFVDPEQIDDFATLRQDIVIDHNGYVEIIDLYPDNETDWTIILQITNGPVTETYNLWAHFYPDEQDNFRVHVDLSPINQPDTEFFKSNIQSVIALLTDDSITTEEFCTNYFTPEFYNDCVDYRNNLNTDDFITIDEFNEIEPLVYELVLNHVEQNNQWWQNIVVVFHQQDDDSYLMEWQFTDPGYTKQREVFEHFINDLNDPNTSNENLCDMYFDNDSIFDCSTLVTESNEGKFISFDGFYSQNGDLFDINIYSTDNTTTTSIHWTIEFVEINELLKIKVINVVEPISEDQVNSFITNFTLEFSDLTIDDFSFASAFASPETQNFLIDLRNNYSNSMISSYNIDFYDGIYILDVSFDNGETISLDLYFYQINDTWIADFYPEEQHDQVNYDDLWAMLEQNIWDFNDSKSTNDFCLSVFSFESFIRCSEDFSEITDQNFDVELSNLMLINNHWQIELRVFNNDNSESFITLDVVAFYDESGQIKLDYMDQSPIFEFDKQNLMWTISTEINDANTDINSFCNSFFTEDSYDTCLQMFDAIRTDGLNIYPENWDFQSPTNWVEFTVFDPYDETNTYSLHVDLDFHFDSVNNIIFVSIIDYYPLNNVPEEIANSILNEIYNDFTNTSLSNDDFFTKWDFLDSTSNRNFRHLILSGTTVLLDSSLISNRDYILSMTTTFNDQPQMDSFLYLTMYDNSNGETILNGYFDCSDPSIMLEIADTIAHETAHQVQQQSIMNFCQDFNCPDNLLQDGRIIQSVEVLDVNLNMDNPFDYIQTTLLFQLDDNTTLSFDVSISYSINPDGTFEYSIQNLYLSDPNFIVTDEDIDAAIYQFMDDLYDSSIDDQTLCEMYFTGEFPNSECFPHRQDVIATDSALIVSKYFDFVDEAGTIDWIVEFEWVHPDYNDSMYVGIHVYPLDDNTYSIQFYQLSAPTPNNE
jgi:hypothetical protein